MWIQVLVTFIVIKLSEESCGTLSNIGEDSFYTDDFVHKIQCSHITLDFDINDFLKSHDGNSSVNVIIEKSNLTELTEKMFHNINVIKLTIQADVKTIQSKTFENSTISSLILDNNHITEIEDLSFDSSSIVSLSLRNNNLIRIKTNTFHEVQALKNIYLRNNSIAYIEENSFNSLIDLVTLDLSFNKLSKLETQLFRNLTKLEMIYLNDNQLTELDDMFYNCKCLIKLIIENNLLTRLEGKHYPHSLISIKASNNTLKSIHFSSLPNLRIIDFSSNELTSIADWSCALSSLEELYLNHILIGPFIDSKELSHLNNLIVTEMNNNGLLNIDIGLFNNFPNLRFLSLAQNFLRNFTVSDYGVHLISLNLSKNYLSEVKNLSIMQDLETLDLSYNHLQEIEFHMFDQLSELKYLFLEYNAIHTIHMGCFKDLKSLEKLALSHNEISVVDVGAFTGADALFFLDISYNNITHLDENVFHNLKDLYKLNIAHNKLSNIEIKTLISHSPYLFEIGLTGNKWTCDSLVELMKGKTSFSHDSHYYNVTNVFGIPCIKNKSDQSIQSKNVVNSFAHYDSIQEISYKMSVSNMILIILFILLCIKFGSVTCFSGYNAARRYFDQKYRYEQEVELI